MIWEFFWEILWVFISIGVLLSSEGEIFFSVFSRLLLKLDQYLTRWKDIFKWNIRQTYEWCFVRKMSKFTANRRHSLSLPRSHALTLLAKQQNPFYTVSRTSFSFFCWWVWPCIFFQNVWMKFMIAKKYPWMMN